MWLLWRGRPRSAQLTGIQAAVQSEASILLNMQVPRFTSGAIDGISSGRQTHSWNLVTEKRCSIGLHAPAVLAAARIVISSGMHSMSHRLHRLAYCTAVYRHPVILDNYRCPRQAPGNRLTFLIDWLMFARRDINCSEASLLLGLLYIVFLTTTGFRLSSRPAFNGFRP